MRADAEANLDRVLEAAKHVFAEHGIDAPIDLVAQRAGVGMGTVYRRFATKDALVAELVNQLLADVIAIGERHLTDPDGSGLTNYMVETCELLATRRGTGSRLWGIHCRQDLTARSRRVQQQLVDDAKRHHVIRTDLTAEDIAVALWAVHGILDITQTGPSDAWRRHLTFVVAGFNSYPVADQLNVSRQRLAAATGSGSAS